MSTLTQFLKMPVLQALSTFAQASPGEMGSVRDWMGDQLSFCGMIKLKRLTFPLESQSCMYLFLVSSNQHKKAQSTYHSLGNYHSHQRTVHLHPPRDSQTCPQACSAISCDPREPYLCLDSRDLTMQYAQIQVAACCQKYESIHLAQQNPHHLDRLLRLLNRPARHDVSFPAGLSTARRQS